jgi:hypothetical protein
VLVQVFPALFKPVVTGQAAETILIEGEAGCFYHPQKRAVVPCAECGRFLCALCDVEIDDRHFCPGCLATGKKRGAIKDLEDWRPLHGRLAFILAVLPLFVTGWGALYLCLRYWRTPGSLVRPARWQMPWALALALLQIAGFGLLGLVWASK